MQKGGKVYFAVQNFSKLYFLKKLISANFDDMKMLSISIVLLLLLAACGNNNNANTKETIEPAAAQSVSPLGDSATNFFPVTSYLKGELLNIRSGGITPVRKITIADKTDSSWLKMEELEKVFAAFLSPVIDTTNLKDAFDQKIFKDETLNAFTFTYDPKNAQTNTFAFTHWDVYVDPESNKVTRIYLSKKEGTDKTLQLTWQSGKRCKIRTLKNANGKTTVEKEENISWSFD
jgi:hypothetical protein